MTDTDEPQYRAYHRPDPDRVELREEDGGDGDDGGTFRVRMPIATTGEVRNEGDDPLTREELEGMAQQIDERAVGVFGDHGANPDMAGSRYSAFEKLGEWEDPEIQSRDDGDEDELAATARMMDPETLPESTGMLREGLSRLKEQAKREMSLSSSIGWRDDDAYPGGVDLMETSIVGIGADPRTTSQAAIAQARGVVMGPDADEQRHLSGQQAEMAVQVLDAYRDGQGNGSVDNFESWLWSARGQFDEGMLHATKTALQEFYRDTTPLDEPVTEQFGPFLEDRQSGDDENTNNMTDDTDPDGEQNADPDDDRDGSDGISAGEFREQMLEMQRTQTETLNTVAEVVREDDDDDDDEGEEGDDDDDDDDDDDGDRSITIDGEEMTADEAVRKLADDVEDADPDTDDDRDADGEDSEPDEERNSDPKDLL